ncbi:MAG TPA: peptidyl-alpha-hydroxyglycine alpha-amidating lyase family protein [Chloroflexota bacterium]|nr:peptidyl-alpha-hydroxyglycine alpha-amidating lyase family protein [Chloroflexota bacterium]
MITIEAGERQYELVENWGTLPAGWEWGQVAGVACDSKDQVHVYTRTEHPYMVFDRSGTMLSCGGEGGKFDTAHSLYIDPVDSVFVLSHKGHFIMKFDAGGQLQLTLGERGKPADTGFTKEGRVPASPWASGGGLPITNGVGHGGPPFYEPTDVAVANNGDIFVSDGYRNSRVHKFSADGELITSWGEPGHARDLRNTTSGPGLFHTPHGIWVEGDRVYVLDRENNRIQVFTTDGGFLTMWTHLERPTDMYVDRSGIAYVSELEDHVSILDLDGNLIGRFGSERSHAPGKFWGPHALWADSSGDLYVAEVLEGQRVQKFARTK